MAGQSFICLSCVLPAMPATPVSSRSTIRKLVNFRIGFGHVSFPSFPPQLPHQHINALGGDEG